MCSSFLKKDRKQNHLPKSKHLNDTYKYHFLKAFIPESISSRDIGLTTIRTGYLNIKSYDYKILNFWIEFTLQTDIKHILCMFLLSTNILYVLRNACIEFRIVGL